MSSLTFMKSQANESLAVQIYWTLNLLIWSYVVTILRSLRHHYLSNSSKLNWCLWVCCLLSTFGGRFCWHRFIWLSENLLILVIPSVCVFISFHRKGFSWLNKTINVMLEFSSAMVYGRNISVSSIFVTTS